MSFNPQSNLTVFIILPGIAGLVLLIGATLVAAILNRLEAGEPQLRDTGLDGDDRGKSRKMVKLRYVLLAVTFWIALSVFFILDVWLSVSVNYLIVAIYAAFWILAAVLLLHGTPARDKLLILGLFVIVVSCVRFIDWNSRKPFLKDLYGIEEGMTAAQVDQIMGDYMRGGGRPIGSPPVHLSDQGEIVAGTVTYRHTDEGWGDSDWGVVFFENGRVVRTEFLPD